MSWYRALRTISRVRIVFIGIVDFSYHGFSEVLRNGGEVVGVVTSESGRNNSDYRDLAPLAREHDIPLHLCRNVNDPETLAWIRSLQPDIIFCWGWSQLIKKELLDLPPMGVVGVHPALLPANRGRHPLIWALVLGLRESGLTFFFMDEGADSGPILSQRTFQITDEDNAATLYAKIKQLASEQIAEFLPRLIDGTFKAVPQDHAKANTWRKRSRKDGLIDWRMNERSILNLVRALAKPYPGAEFQWGESSVTVWKARTLGEPVSVFAEPGRVLGHRDGKPVVRCMDGAIVLEETEPAVTLEEGAYL